jgi:hypothetical protein
MPGGEINRKDRKEPKDRGKSTTNVNGITLPRESLFEVCVPAKTGGQGEWRMLYRVTVTNAVARHVSKAETWPEMPGLTVVSDFRFLTTGQRLFLRYSAERWLSDSEVKLLPQYQRAAAIVTLFPQSSMSTAEPARRSLEGSALPDLASVGLSSDTLPAGKPALICLLDCEQRPSRRTLRQLLEQHGAFEAQGIVLVAIQSAIVSDETWDSIKEDNAAPFLIGRVVDNSATTRWVTAVDKLPWLILVDSKGRVAAEGFSLEELETNVRVLTR